MAETPKVPAQPPLSTGRHATLGHPGSGGRGRRPVGVPSCSPRPGLHMAAGGSWGTGSSGGALCRAGYVTFGSPVLSEVSLPLHVAEGCPSVCVLALRARPPGCSVCHLGLGPAGLLPSADFSPWLLGDAPGRDVLELRQAGGQSSLTLSLASRNRCRRHRRL